MPKRTDPEKLLRMFHPIYAWRESGKSDIIQSFVTFAIFLMLWNLFCGLLFGEGLTFITYIIFAFPSLIASLPWCFIITDSIPPHDGGVLAYHALNYLGIRFFIFTSLGITINLIVIPVLVKWMFTCYRSRKAPHKEKSDAQTY